MDIPASELRKALDAERPTDADRVVFCIDAELTAGKRLGDGMDRVAKIHLIRQQHKPSAVHAASQKYRGVQIRKATMQAGPAERTGMQR